MMKWAAGLPAVGCVLVMAATSGGADFEYSASRTVGKQLFHGACTRVVVADSGKWLMIRRCKANGGGVTSHEGQVFLAHSLDDGETWTDDGKLSNDVYDAINAEFVKYPNGDIEVFYTRYDTSTSTPYQNMVCRSTDNGSTWSAFQAAAPPLREPSTVMWQEINAGNTTYLVGGEGRFFKTTNNGNSWTEVSRITAVDEDEDGYCEPGLAYLGNGEFLAVLRCNGPDLRTIQRRSMDWGQTWETDGYIKNDGSVNPDKNAGTNVALHQCRMWTEDINGNDLGYIYKQANLYPGHYPRSMYAHFSTDDGDSWGPGSLIESRAHDSALVLKSRSSAKYYPGRTASEGKITCDDINIVVPPPIPGDANDDGIVDDEDASILAAHWQQTGREWEHGDFNGDGVVDEEDASILAANWQETAEGAPVPEPGMLALLAGALLSLLVWRRR
jgi:hypothetical protein